MLSPWYHEAPSLVCTVKQEDPAVTNHCSELIDNFPYPH